MPDEILMSVFAGGPIRTIKTAYIWTVQKPNGAYWNRRFLSIDTAWACLLGTGVNGSALFSKPKGHYEAMGYKVVPVAWSVTYVG